MAAPEAAKEAVYLREFLNELGFRGQEAHEALLRQPGRDRLSLQS